jgi:RNA polymerase sigma-70 factor (ECF subfamily)
MSEKDLKSRQREINKLVESVQKGSQESFAELYDIFVEPIYKYVFYRVKEGDAEDIVENTFLRVWEGIKSYQLKKNKTFSSWIFRIAHNLIIDHYRSTKDREYSPLNEMQPDTTREHNPIRKAEDYFDQVNLRVALSNIKKKYQELIVYKFVNSLTNKEIADIMGQSEGSLRVLQFRALKALKEELDKIGVKY